ncbi:DNA-cytosine methyltransferase [Paenibacillus alvei TS-15]|uniref:Cytosine-specific methyltransferase n=1 Tax=Paenibacillus alvei TS-15 TaxID=1117108 RepID=S9SJX9_PAEAL|nr:DNA cytosine methyltransferase [Paenibacillus alvei]EPY04403.1 DNA-cytosine methyltransferase [Paenibacillus alvei TS-15]
MSNKVCPNHSFYFIIDVVCLTSVFYFDKIFKRAGEILMYKVLDLFAGCGGLSEGFVTAGFNVAASIEIDEKACETKRLNHPDTKVIQADLTQYSPTDLLEETKIKEFDLIIGGPPCQGFSLIGTRLGTSKLGKFIEDPRNKLYKEFVKYVRFFQPKMFLMENVPGLFSMHQGQIKEQILEDFSMDDPNGEFIGYEVKAQIVKAVEFGVPQTRERAIFIGVRKDISVTFEHPSAVFTEDNYFTVRDAIGDLPKLGIKDGKPKVPYTQKTNKYLELLNGKAKRIKRNNGYEEGYLYNHVTRFHNDRDRDIFRMIEPFQKLKDLDPEIIPIRLRNGFDDFYRKMDFNKPSPTIIAHLYKDGLAFVHPDGEQARSISIREAARLQSFPDSFVFVGTQSAMYKQIGNAVPPLLGYHLALHIKKILKEIKKGAELLDQCVV